MKATKDAPRISRAEADRPALDNEYIGLTEAAKLMRGRKGKAPAIETVRRWANPRRGCRPQGPDGPRLVLLSIRLNGDILTLRDWVAAFEKERFRLGQRGGDPAGCGVMPGQLAGGNRLAAGDGGELAGSGGSGRPRTRKSREAAQRRATERLDREGVKSQRN